MDGYREVKLCRKISSKANQTSWQRKTFIGVYYFVLCGNYKLLLLLVHQVFQNLADSFTEQRRPVMTLLAAIRRCPELSQEQFALRTAWDRLEEEVRKSTVDNKQQVQTLTFTPLLHLVLCFFYMFL